MDIPPFFFNRHTKFKNIGLPLIFKTLELIQSRGIQMIKFPQNEIFFAFVQR